LHQVGDLFELNVKLRCQNVNKLAAFAYGRREPMMCLRMKIECLYKAQD